MMEATKGIGQNYRKGQQMIVLFFDCWLSSKKAEEAAMEVGSKFIGMVKTNTTSIVNMC